jgi:hypothetical protein
MQHLCKFSPEGTPPFSGIPKHVKTRIRFFA